MRRPLTLATVPTLALIGLAAAPAISSAATITPSAPCYSTRFDVSKPSGQRLQYQPMTGTITGGAPGGRFQIYGVGGKAGSQVGNFDAAGNASYSIDSYSSPGINPSAGRDVKLEVQEFGATTAVTGAIGFKVSTITADVSIRPSNPRRSRVVRASDTAFAGKKVYGFIVRGTKGTKVLKRISLGTGNVCGYVRKKSVVAPSNYRTGTYTLFISASTKLDKKQGVAYGFRIRRF